MIFVAIIISVMASVYELLTQQRGIVWIAYGIANPLLLLLPRFIYHVSNKVRQNIGPDQIKKIEFFGLPIILLNIPGSLFLHEMGVQYDRILHFSMGMVSIFVITMTLSIFYEKPIISRRQLLVWSGVFVFLGLFLFEFWQFSADRLFGTTLFFDNMQYIAVDFSEDIIFGSIGLIIGLIYIYFRFNSFVLKK